MADLRIGVVGSGYIAGVIAEAIAEARGAQLVAVASRRPERARAFAQAHGLRAFERWEDLVAWEGLDAVYVATPTAARAPICVAAAQRGKHLLADKPFADLASLRAITAACRAGGVAFLDATHFVHHPRTAQLRRELPERVGPLKTIASAFFFPSSDPANIRFDPAQEPTGAFGDMAWYTLRAAVEFSDPAAQLASASCTIERDARTGACVRVSGAITLSDGVTSTWDAGYTVGAMVMRLELMGERGVVGVDDFVLDWDGGFPGPRTGRPVGFTQYGGAGGPSARVWVDTPSATRQSALLIERLVELAGDPAGPGVAASVAVSERTQALLDAVWARVA